MTKKELEKLEQLHWRLTVLLQEQEWKRRGLL